MTHWGRAVKFNAAAPRNHSVVQQLHVVFTKRLFSWLLAKLHLRLHPERFSLFSMAVRPVMIPIRDLLGLTEEAATAGHHDDFDTGSSLAGLLPPKKRKETESLGSDVTAVWETAAHFSIWLPCNHRAGQWISLQTQTIDIPNWLPSQNYQATSGGWPALCM